jgi:hypothetical protein
VLAHQGLELGDDGRAALRGQRQLGPPLLRPGAQLGQAHRLRDGPGLEGDLRVRLAPPPRQRGVQVGDRPRGVGPRQLLRDLQVGREGVRVQGVGRQPQRSRAAR